MKTRIAWIIGSAWALLVTGATAALAQTSPVQQPPEGEVLPQVEVPPGAVEAGEAGGEGLAFTGAELMLLFATVAALLILGTWLYVAGRRRAARAAS